MKAVWKAARALPLLLLAVDAANPIVPGVGMADPHMHVWPAQPDKVYVYATHDCNRAGDASQPCAAAAGELGFLMEDWWVWSSTDLVAWTQEARVYPTALAYENANTTDECWATDAASLADGTTFFYLSVGPRSIGVVAGPTPAGPFADPLGAPLVAEGDYPTYARDPGVLLDDDGAAYLIFGTFSYFVARLGADMISLAETARGVQIRDLQHSDDKPFLHKRNGVYYLSWGCFYALGASPYGPFNYSGSIIDPARLANTSFADGGGTSDRHGSFFELHGQTYFACNDQSHGGSGGFRSSIIAYAHYRENGSIATLRIDETGVGQYNCSASGGVVEAEDFFAVAGAEKRERLAAAAGDDGFEVVGLRNGSALAYPRVHGLGDGGGRGATLTLRASNGGSATGDVAVYAGGGGAVSARVELLARCAPLAPTGGWDVYVDVACDLPPNVTSPVDLVLAFSGGGGAEFARLDSFRTDPA